MTNKFSRRRLGAMLFAPVVQRIRQYPYDLPKPPPLTDEQQDEAIRENASSNLVLWGLFQLAWHEIGELKGEHIDPYYMQKWEVHKKST